MNEAAIFSNPAQMKRLVQIITSYARLPFASHNIPGALLESALAHVRNAEVLRTYDFVDVIQRQQRIGWQVKSTQAATPVTWKRAKIPNQVALIAESRKSARGKQVLGDAIIDCCNQHALASLHRYELEAIGYARLILHPDHQANYFERRLCTQASPAIFNKLEFEWCWSTAKKTGKKEQLQAFHGIHRATQEKWFAWHGLGENQLHFNGERRWWEEASKLHAVTFSLPMASDQLDLEKFVALLSKLTT
ncbi:MAG: hypothetical protein HY231_02660 [Acidobacteria bacterium]|nr:hypothetical protein [Acidobacteriota bacterium]